MPHSTKVLGLIPGQGFSFFMLSSCPMSKYPHIGLIGDSVCVSCDVLATCPGVFLPLACWDRLQKLYLFFAVSTARLLSKEIGEISGQP